MIDVQIVGQDINGRTSTAQMFKKRDDQPGPIVYTEHYHDHLTEVVPLLNPTFGADMNQAITFAGTPELINNGGDAVGWTGTAIQGAWNFADTVDPFSGTKCVSLTSGDSGDTASFTDATQTDMNNYTAITGQFQLDTYSPTENTIVVQFFNNNVEVGNSIDLDDYIDTGTLGSYQGFVIPKQDLGIDTSIVDEVQISLLRTGGPKPTFRFDVFQIEETGSPATFIYEADQDDIEVVKVKIILVDNVTEAQAQNYNTILGVGALANGITVSVTSAEEIVFSGSFSRLVDFLQIPDMEYETRSDGTNTWITMDFNFLDNPVVIENNGSDSISFTINDDLSGLLFFRTFVKTIRHVIET